MDPIELPKRPLIGLLRTIAIVLVGFLLLSQSIARGWFGYCDYRDHQNISQLNTRVKIYQDRNGVKPDPNLLELYRAGLSKKRLNSTPYGGYYRLDYATGVVVNPNR
jgi:hypothetical protein